MKLRDGVPILIDNQRDYNQTKGYIITFKKRPRKTDLSSNQKYAIKKTVRMENY